MKNVIFEKLKKEFNLPNDENLKLYCDTIWQVYKDNNNRNDFEKTINGFLYKFEKDDNLYLNEKQIHFVNYGEIDNERLKVALKVTNCSNIKEVEEHKFNIIDISEIYPYKASTEDDFDVFIFEDKKLFEKIYIYCATKLFYN
ncbi:hypothetical protein [Flavobacterium yafengii]|uniref:hypothetical protein n=1 Tax=Flavobacterium yafengii TaxID=3041253 RepID=UPI0024A7EED6|nr:hypothetical protein [Flavobacterium yafengii]MDI5899071.1 hypothetical protein [Flavobacterium yafengii]